MSKDAAAVVSLSLTKTHIRKLETIKNRLPGHNNRSSAARFLIDLGDAVVRTTDLHESLACSSTVLDLLKSLRQ